MKRIGLLPRISIAIALGIALGQVMPMGGVRLFATFNTIFAQYLGFLIPLIIVGLVTPAIGDVGTKVGRLLLATLLIAYLDTTLAALLAYGTGSLLFPSMVEATQMTTTLGKATAIAPYFNFNIPPMLDVMTALVFSFMVGMGIAYLPKTTTLKSAAQ